jgi:hypothetical protein
LIAESNSALLSVPTNFILHDEIVFHLRNVKRSVKAIPVKNSFLVFILTAKDNMTRRKKLVRNRWFKAVTLINNPALVIDRLLRRSRQLLDRKMRMDDSDVTSLRCSVIKLQVLHFHITFICIYSVISVGSACYMITCFGR